MFKSINEEKKTFSKKVVDYIKDLIVTGQLNPGDKLPSERDLAEMMNVSRPTIREAFKILSAMGFLEIKHGNGVFVADPKARIDNLAALLFLQTDTIHELFEVRKMIETETAAQAAKCGTPEFLKHILTKTQEVYQRVSQDRFKSKEEWEDYLSHSDHEFHLMVAHASGNAVVLRLMNNLIDLLLESRMKSMKIPGRGIQSLKEHLGIAEALVNKDPDLARLKMLEHLSSVKHDLIQELNEEEKKGK